MGFVSDIVSLWVIVPTLEGQPLVGETVLVGWTTSGFTGLVDFRRITTIRSFRLW